MSQSLTRREFLTRAAAGGVVAGIAGCVRQPEARQAPVAAEPETCPACAVANTRSYGTQRLPGEPEAGAKFLFIDAQHVERADGVERVFHPPVKHRGPVVFPDKPWEVDFLHHRDAPVWSPERNCWQLWYYGGPEEQLPLYAESTDGVTWNKPSLGLVQWRGSTENNIVDMGFPIRHFKEHHLTVLRDDRDPDPARRYKALTYVSGKQSVRPLVSADGTRWKPLDGADTIASDDQYRLNYDALRNRYVATVKSHLPPRLRAVSLSLSDDFVRWSPAQRTFAADETDQEIGKKRIDELLADRNRRQPVFIRREEYLTDVYNMPVFTYADMQLGLPVMFNHSGNRPGRNQDGILYPMLVVSRDLQSWDRLSRQPFLTHSRLADQHNWDHAMLHVCRPVRIGDELWFYYTGARFTHLDAEALAAAQLRKANEPIRGVFLARLRLDGFASFHAGPAAGTVVTKPVKVTGTSFLVNIDAKAGELRAEVRDQATGQPIPGYTFADSEMPAGNKDGVRLALRWKTKNGLAELKGRTVRVAFSLRDADLYSFWFDEPRPV